MSKNQGSNSLKFQQKVPSLLRITPSQAECITNCFKLYDYKATGKIPRHLAKKLVRSVGYADAPVGNLAREVSLKEVLLFLDEWSPPLLPEFDSALSGFTGMVLQPTEEGNVVTASAISNFLESIGKPPSHGEVSLYASFFSFCFKPNNFFPNQFLPTGKIDP